LSAFVVQVRSKIWIEAHGRPVLGPGRLELLRAVEERGSISGAARFLKISYRKAWGQIRAMEERLGLPLMTKQSGGPGGGGTRLTAEAREFLKKYVHLVEGLEELVDRRFGEVFFCGKR
jgi:molybdate transport system regulatory protein